ncbi:Hint domain-containing protein [Limobrevibacterium gyesilva]|uniref:Hint domain-containing protein n=1 Tax=Limobrevibacterium gyesilva TaxID=2991712 RepID=A0AA42CJT7_9PROT|nr:Hint domain-containing protein [Limobrevibacterium gyesilva]MCW3477185.1 Hint domain-containing protein [Limobrevibacterium gyesilva]
MPPAVPNFALTAAAGIACSDGTGGASLTAAPSGLAAGTRIAVPGGTAAVEDLRPGDAVATASGTAHVLRATRHAFTADALALRPDARPVRIGAGALAAGVPVRDLLLAPAQWLELDGMAAPAAALVNGASIRRDAAPADVAYISLRLDAPGALLAEAVACPALPRRSSPAATASLRLLLERLAALSYGPLQGHLEQATHHGAAGWVLDEHRPTTPVALEAVADGVVIAHLLADQRRPDLEMAGLGDGRCGFAVRFPHPLPADRGHILQIRRTADGADMSGSPLLLPPAGGTAEALHAALDRPPAPGDAARDALAAFLAERIDRLLQARIERQGGIPISLRTPPCGSRRSGAPGLAGEAHAGRSTAAT